MSTSCAICFSMACDEDRMSDLALSRDRCGGIKQSSIYWGSGVTVGACGRMIVGPSTPHVFRLVLVFHHEGFHRSSLSGRHSTGNSLSDTDFKCQDGQGTSGTGCHEVREYSTTPSILWRVKSRYSQCPDGIMCETLWDEIYRLEEDKIDLSLIYVAK